MTAKEYLGQAYRLDQRINSKLQQVDSLRSLTQKITASYDGEVVSHTRNVTSLQDTIIRLMEAEEELNRQIDELVDLKMDMEWTTCAKVLLPIPFLPRMISRLSTITARAKFRTIPATICCGGCLSRRATPPC